MTEKSASDVLRELLDERGIEWSSPELRPLQTRLPNVKFEPWGEGTLKVTIFNLTPEQAIAATLGSEREIELGDALNEVAEKWAIAQVEAEDCAKRCMLLEELVQDWQALYEEPDYGDCCRLRKRMQELGIEVIDE